MKKIVINRCYGGFGVSKECAKWMAEREHQEAQKALIDETNVDEDEFFMFEPNREDNLLIEAIETLGSELCSGNFSELTVVEIPEDVKYIIQEYDGKEWIAEAHRRWS